MPPQADPTTVMETKRKHGQKGRRPRNGGPGKQAKRKKGEPEELDSSRQEEGEIGCICNYEDDDGFMIQCETCLIWQHSICVGISKDNVPDRFFCELCQPREVNREAANEAQKQQRRRQREEEEEDEIVDPGQPSYPPLSSPPPTTIPPFSSSPSPSFSSPAPSITASSPPPSHPSAPSPASALHSLAPPFSTPTSAGKPVNSHSPSHPGDSSQPPSPLDPQHQQPPLLPPFQSLLPNGASHTPSHPPFSNGQASSSSSPTEEHPNHRIRGQSVTDDQESDSDPDYDYTPDGKRLSSDDSKKMTREQKKLKQIMESFNKIEERTKKKKPGPTPKAPKDEQAQTKKRKGPESVEQPEPKRRATPPLEDEKKRRAVRKGSQGLISPSPQPALTPKAAQLSPAPAKEGPGRGRPPSDEPRGTHTAPSSPVKTGRPAALPMTPTPQQVKGEEPFHASPSAAASALSPSPSPSAHFLGKKAWINKFMSKEQEKPAAAAPTASPAAASLTPQVKVEPKGEQPAEADLVPSLSPSPSASRFLPMKKKIVHGFLSQQADPAAPTNPPPTPTPPTAATPSAPEFGGDSQVRALLEIANQVVEKEKEAARPPQSQQRPAQMAVPPSLLEPQPKQPKQEQEAPLLPPFHPAADRAPEPELDTPLPPPQQKVLTPPAAAAPTSAPPPASLGPSAPASPEHPPGELIPKAEPAPPQPSMERPEDKPENAPSKTRVSLKDYMQMRKQSSPLPTPPLPPTSAQPLPSLVQPPAKPPSTSYFDRTSNVPSPLSTPSQPSKPLSAQTSPTALSPPSASFPLSSSTFGTYSPSPSPASIWAKPLSNGQPAQVIEASTYPQAPAAITFTPLPSRDPRWERPSAPAPSSSSSLPPSIEPSMFEPISPTHSPLSDGEGMELDHDLKSKQLPSLTATLPPPLPPSFLHQTPALVTRRYQ